MILSALIYFWVFFGYTGRALSVTRFSHNL